jgi:hypothetical protein
LRTHGLGGLALADDFGRWFEQAEELAFAARVAAAGSGLFNHLPRRPIVLASATDAAVRETRLLLAKLEIGHQAHEALVLMVLVMAVQQAGPRIVGDEIDLKAAHPRQVDRILHHAGSHLVADTRDLEGMPV